MSLNRLLREPLLHFFLLGALLFVLFSYLHKGVSAAPDEILVDAARISALSTQYERIWQRPPSAPELKGLIADWVRDEIMYREGVALGLDRDDPVIRRRVAQKVAFMSDALVDDRPGEAELERWLAEHRETYRIEPVVSMRQVYFDPQRHKTDLTSLIETARSDLAAGVSEAEAIHGDTTLLPAKLQGGSRSDIARIFGAGFADEVVELPVGVWSGPVRSGYGLHLVRLDDLQAGRDATLDEVRMAVTRDLVAARKAEADEAFYDALRQQYEVVIAGEEATNAPGTPGS
ncbi:MAG TPA: peptidylprolyl isomerase [Woeseiaceae bacterium]|nr:peptidylprolyl isomerase [Woeseiaceae bacterium]